MYQFVRENWVAADSQRRRNNALFPRSEAKGKWELFRSQRRRLRLSAVAARGNRSVICRTFSRHLHIWFDQQRGNMLVFSLCSQWFCSFRRKLQNGSVRRDGPWGGLVRSDSSTISRSIFLRKEHSVRKQFSHLMSNIIQGETKRSTPLILCLDEARLEGSRGGPKGSKQIWQIQ